MMISIMTSTSFRVTRARLEHLSKVTRLETRVWQGMAAPHSVIRRRFFLYPQGFKVALIGTEIAGFCCAALFDQDATSMDLNEYFPPGHIPLGKYCFLFGLTVNPVYRRQGIGTALVENELKTAERKRCLKVQAIANSFSQPLFRANAFEVVTPLPGLFKKFSELMPDPALMERTFDLS
jgi:GNAT superfamily N-acetyltransferase